MNNGKEKINIKARVDRHLRIVRKSGGLNSNALNDKKIGYNVLIVIIFIVFVFPVYPSLASFVYNSSSYDFYRGYIDESSIIEAYYGGDLEDGTGSYGIPIIESEDSFLSVNTILNDKRDLTGTNEIISYEIKPGDSFSSLSYGFNISVNSILWANDFDSNHTLRPGELIKIPPISGILHKVVRGDSISTIAKKYDIGESKIREQNGVKEGDIIRIGQTLVVPGAVRKVTTPSYTNPTKAANNASSNSGNSGNSGGYNFASSASSQITSETGSYKLTRRKPKHSFAWGNCTWYVSQYKNVNWGGNANQWIKNASAKGHSTGKSPSTGAIIQFAGTGYNPRYGHVGIVMEVGSDYLIVSDMNYRRLNEITYRKIPTNDRSIVGYIYVE